MIIITNYLFQRIAIKTILFVTVPSSPKCGGAVTSPGSPKLRIYGSCCVSFNVG